MQVSCAVPRGINSCTMSSSLLMCASPPLDADILNVATEPKTDSGTKMDYKLALLSKRIQASGTLFSIPATRSKPTILAQCIIDHSHHRQDFLIFPLSSNDLNANRHTLHCDRVVNRLAALIKRF